MTRLLETVRQSDAKLDREAGIVRNVKILGRESRNGRTYSDKALDDAARLYEGAPVNIDHDRKEPHRERGLMEGFGELRGTKRQGDAVFGDLHYPTKHPSAPLFEEMAERFPNKIGLSHNADGSTRREKKGEIVESISRVISVDVVRNPATNKGLWESASKTAADILIEMCDEKPLEASGLLEMDYAAQEVAGMADSMSGDQQMLLALESMIAAVLRNEQFELGDKKQQIIKILNAFGSLAGGESGEDKPPEEQPKGDSEEQPDGENNKEPFMADQKKKEEEKPTQESTKLAKMEERLTLLESENANLKKQEKARQLLADNKLEADAVLIESLVNAPNDDAAKRIIEREKVLQSQKPVTRTKPLVESRLTKEQIGEYPKSTKDFAAALR